MNNYFADKKWYNVLLNKYLIVGLAFVIWMAFFDQNSYILHKKLDEDVQLLKEERAYLKGEINHEGAELKQLEKNPEEFEKLAREKYLMKRDGEDIFVIEKKDSLVNE